MHPSTLAKRVWILLFLAVIAIYFYGLGYLPLVGPDEPRYAQVAREMYQRADLITPTLGGHTWFEKPALLYWMMIAAFRAFGVSETSARLGSAISGLLTIAAVFWVGRRVARVTADAELWGLGPWSALVAASMLGLIVFSRAASFDIVVTMTITWALACFFASDLEMNEAKRRQLLTGFYVFVGLSLLAKGLIGIVIPFGVIGLYQLLRRAMFSKRFLFTLIWGVPLALAVAALWYAPVIMRHGWPFIDEFFVQHHLARYFSNRYRHPGPVYFYLLCLVPLTLPWTILLIEGMWKARFWNSRGNDAGEKLRVFALAWLLFPLAFFSFSTSKLAGYILPVLPAAALIAGIRLARFTSGSVAGRTAIRLTGSSLLLIAGAGAILGMRSGMLSTKEVVLVIAPLIVAGVLTIAFTRQKTVAAFSIAFAALLFAPLVLNTGLIKLAAAESVRDLITAADQKGYTSAPVYGLGEIHRTAEFYAAGHVAYGTAGEPIVFENATQVVEEASRRGPILVLVPLANDQLVRLKTFGAEVIGDNGDFALVALNGSKK